MKRDDLSSIGHIVPSETNLRNYGRGCNFNGGVYLLNKPG